MICDQILIIITSFRSYYYKIIFLSTVELRIETVVQYFKSKIRDELRKSTILDIIYQDQY